MLIHLRVWWRFYISFVAVWMFKNFLPSALQGIASETGQTIYGWVTWINTWLLDVAELMKWADLL